MKFVLLRFGLMNELACQLINLSTRQPVNSSTTHIIKFNVQTSKFKGKMSDWGVTEEPIFWVYP